ncbi:SelL-related redox protein [Candidatus Protochlamydia phocaeensis]|uniref:SelL-related redox protein n=1 Tax=Candidatus Protochlamydia phocaeensis TaxID=1414722 RepID=UPI000838EB6D|nr:SelL-related redox protein [Candidatus Protochlamydia phocaeensis]
MNFFFLSSGKWMRILLIIACLFFWAASYRLSNEPTWDYALLFLLTGSCSLIIAIDPKRLWPLLICTNLFLIGVIIKLLFDANQPLIAPENAFWILIGCIWLILYSFYLYHSYQIYLHDIGRHFAFETADEAIRYTIISSEKKTLMELSNQTPLLIVFLRYIGCPFCRQTLRHMMRQREALEKRGYQIIFIHMDNEQEAKSFFKRYGLEDFLTISDPDRHLYYAFGLERHTLLQLFHPYVGKEWIKSLWTNGSGAIHSDPFQMPGMFVLYKGRITYFYRPDYVSEQPDYQDLLSMSEANQKLTEFTQNFQR